MPSATGKFYGNGLLFLLNGAVVWGTDDTYLALASSSYTPDIDAHDFWADVVSTEVTGTNWAAGGVQADGETLSDGKHVILYTRTPGSDATRELIGYATMDTALAPAGGTLLLDFATTGWALIDYT
jgi:hypothetical protein